MRFQYGAIRGLDQACATHDVEVAVNGKVVGYHPYRRTDPVRVAAVVRSARNHAGCSNLRCTRCTGNVHIHLSPFQVLSRGLGGPGAFDAGWKDTIDLRPSEEAIIAIRFDDYAGKYVFHCHNLEHEDMAMMANFTTH